MVSTLKRLWLIVLLLTVFVLPIASFAGESDPRDALPAPGGTDAFLFYYRNISGNQLNVNGNVSTRNAELNMNLGIARYVHYWAFGPWTVAANLIQPFGSVHTELGPLDEQASGIGDTTGNVTVWYPLLSKNDNMFWLAAGLYVAAPTGQYNNDKFINMGANRWNYRIEVVPVAWKYKAFSLEVVGNVDFYTDNDDYTVNHLTLKQDPLYSAFGHITYDVTKTFWVGASYFLHTGGETKINDVEQNDSVTEHKLMFTTAFQTTAQTQLMLQYATDVHMSDGVSTNAIQARFAYFW